MAVITDQHNPASDKRRQALTNRVRDRSAENTDWPLSIGAALIRAAQRWPDAEALVEGDRRWTFQQYASAVADLARGLLAEGLRKGDRIAIWAPNSADVAIASFAAHTIGAVVIPLNTRLTGYEAAELIRRAHVRAVVVRAHFLNRDYLDELRAHDVTKFVRLLITIEMDVPAARSLADVAARVDEVAEHEFVERAAEVGPDDIADIMFTSGTTGVPKGAMLRHGASVRGFTEYGRSVGLVEGDRMVGIPPFFHTFGSKGVLLTAVLYGAAVMPVAVFDVHDLVDLIDSEHATVLQGSPTIFLGLLDDPAVDKSRLATVRVAGPGSMGFPANGFARIRDELGIEEFSPGYALTESHACCTRVYWFDDFETASTTAGWPIPGTELKIVDEAGADLGSGTDGEIVVRGYTVMTGYLDDPAGTAAAVDADGWLHTGDIGHLDELGRLIVTDRKKDMFLVGGFNAYPAEIERVIGAHPAVAEVAVIGVPDQRLGEVGMAFVVLREPNAAGAEDLEAFARERLANYKRPRSWRLVEALPRNASGKVQKFALREQVPSQPKESPR